MNRHEMLCEVFAGSRRAGSYLFVRRDEGLERVPAALLERFGAPRSVLTLKLFPGRALAQVSAERVLEAIAEHGYYLQLPPGDESQPGSRSGEPDAETEAGRGAHLAGGDSAC